MVWNLSVLLLQDKEEAVTEPPKVCVDAVNGPYGGNGGGAFSDENSATHGDITKIKVRYGVEVDGSVHFLYFLQKKKV